VRTIALYVLVGFGAFVAVLVACARSWGRGWDAAERYYAAERSEIGRRACRVRDRYEPERRSGMEVWN
jgi:hypothetical protein